MKSAAAIQHIGFEYLGAFATVIRASGINLHFWDSGQKELWTLEPASRRPIHSPAKRSAFSNSAERPIMGVCLGAQLIARAVGAESCDAELARKAHRVAAEWLRQPQW